MEKKPSANTEPAIKVGILTTMDELGMKNPTTAEAKRILAKSANVFAIRSRNKGAGSEKEAEEFALDLAKKLENNEISLAKMAEDIDNFLINQKNGED